MSATHLARILADHQFMRLVLLNSCEGATSSDTDIFSSTAATLMRRGIPAVIAMQYEITDRAAIEFSRSFYEALVNGMAVDAAVAEARKAVSIGVNNTIEWGTPVLFLRAADGLIFDIEKVTLSNAPEPVGFAPTGKTEKFDTPESTHTPSEDKLIPKPFASRELNPEMLWNLNTNHDKIYHLAFSPDGRLLASASGGGSRDTGPLILWSVQNGEKVSKLEISNTSVLFITFSPDNKLLASYSSERIIHIWQVQGGRLLYTIETSGKNYPFRFSSDSSTLLIPNWNEGYVQIVNLDEGSHKKNILLQKSSDIGVFSSCVPTFAADTSILGMLIIRTGVFSDLYWWRLSDGKLLHNFKIHPQQIRALDTDGKLLVVTGTKTITTTYQKRKVSLFRISDGELLRVIDSPVGGLWNNLTDDANIRSLALSVKGDLLALGTAKGVIGVVRTSDGELLELLRNHNQEVTCLTFSNDDTLFASGSSDQTITLWRLRETIQKKEN